jgi:hypothetical protein
MHFMGDLGLMDIHVIICHDYFLVPLMHSIQMKLNGFTIHTN